ADRQQKLPEAAQVQVLGALMAEPEPELSELVVDPEELTGEAAEDDHRQRSEKGEHSGLLSSRLAPSDQRSEEQSSRDPGRRDPEDRELEMPGPQEVVGKPGREIEAVEGSGLDPIMGERAPREGLQQEEQRDHSEVQAGGLLARCQLPARQPVLVR